MIPKILWPTFFSEPHPFGGPKGMRPLSLTFQSRIDEGITDKEKQALGILGELIEHHQIDVMSFDGNYYPKILFDPSERTNKTHLKIIGDDGKQLMWNGGVANGWISRNILIDLLGWYSEDREREFEIAKNDLLEARAHHALNRDIFITTSKFLLENRAKLEELNIRTPIEALRILGLYIRTKNESEWVAKVKGGTPILIGSCTFYAYLVHIKLPDYLRFATNLNQVPNKIMFTLILSIRDKSEKVLRARDEIAKLFYMLETNETDLKQGYHFDYLTLLLTGILDTLALVVNEIYKLFPKKEDQNKCSFNNKEFRKKIRNNAQIITLDNFLNTVWVTEFIKILHKLRNKIHSISLASNTSVPLDDVDDVVDDLYNFDCESHMGITMERVSVVSKDGSSIPSFSIKIDKYSLALMLAEKSFYLTNAIMDLITPSEVQGNFTSHEVEWIERCSFLG